MEIKVELRDKDGSGDQDIFQRNVKDDTGDLHGSCDQNGSAGDHDCFEVRNSSDDHDSSQGHLFNPLKTQRKDENRNNDLISEVEWRKDLVSEMKKDTDSVPEVNREKDFVSDASRNKDLVSVMRRGKYLASEVMRGKDLASEVDFRDKSTSEIERSKILIGNVNGNKSSVSSGIQSKKFASALKMSQDKVSDTNGDEISSMERNPSNSDLTSKNITNNKDISVKSSTCTNILQGLNKSPEPEESTPQAIAEDSEMNITVYRAYLSAPKTSVR